MPNPLCREDDPVLLLLVQLFKQVLSLLLSLLHRQHQYRRVQLALLPPRDRRRLEVERGRPVAVQPPALERDGLLLLRVLLLDRRQDLAQLLLPLQRALSRQLLCLNPPVCSNDRRLLLLYSLLLRLLYP